VLELNRVGMIGEDELKELDELLLLEHSMIALKTSLLEQQLST
jgi:hypothetical protein